MTRSWRLPTPTSTAVGIAGQCARAPHGRGQPARAPPHASPMLLRRCCRCRCGREGAGQTATVRRRWRRGASRRPAHPLPRPRRQRPPGTVPIAPRARRAESWVGAAGDRASHSQGGAGQSTTRRTRRARCAAESIPGAPGPAPRPRPPPPVKPGTPGPASRPRRPPPGRPRSPGRPPSELVHGATVRLIHMNSCPK
eukprot:scaffold1990_cov118-Isochrysis_galbana.AAC.2